jgi:anti-sigma factor (TIGR02949 family)
MTDAKSTSCREILAGISAYLDGELGTAACDEIERHCQDCPSCASVVQGLRETVGLCREAGLVSLPEALRQRARDRMRLLLDQEQ